MLEDGDKLRTWALAQLPRDWQCELAQPNRTSNSVAATQLADHRLDYLDYQGPLSGDRGNVTRLEAGTYVNDFESTELWQVTLNGQKLHGQITLSRDRSVDTAWTLTVSSRE